MPKFAANLSTLFTDVPFPARFARAAAAGFKAVEFQFPYDHPADEIGAALRANGLACVMFNMPPGNPGEKGLAAALGRERDFAAGVEMAVTYARTIGAWGLHAMAGVAAPADFDAHYETYVRNLSRAARRLAVENLTLLIEPINRTDVPMYFIHNMEIATQAIDYISEHNVKIQMDFYHVQMSEGGLTALYQRHAARIGHVQISSVPGRHEPDQGEIHYAHIFRMLDSSGYAGWVGCEYKPRGVTEDGLGWMKTLV